MSVYKPASADLGAADRDAGRDRPRLRSVLPRRAARRQLRRPAARREASSPALAGPHGRSSSGTAPRAPIPYIVAREGEMEESLLDLRAFLSSAGSSRISYWNETLGDRDGQGVLWARFSQSRDEHGDLTGAPRWKMISTPRQREAMSKLLCQFCGEPARMPDGRLLFLNSKEECGPNPNTTIRTAQPPFCLKHARMAPQRCPHLAEHGYVALLTQSAPLYGVIGTPYQYTADRTIQAMACDGVPVPYGSAALDWIVAAQLVRTPRAYTVVNLEDL
ncbi:hypothetical protein AB0B59_09255 [Streptomyces huasconensis]|uniref:hypothetical protein n=1 Tax=Streptomyces huasconensis TaxID=1854574 RepID=UPI0033E24EC5